VIIEAPEVSLEIKGSRSELKTLAAFEEATVLLPRTEPLKVKVMGFQPVAK